jgi:hypothetical protein
MFLVLSIFITITQPFFMFACRNKDLGMVPENYPREDCAESKNLL